MISVHVIKNPFGNREEETFQQEFVRQGSRISDYVPARYLNGQFAVVVSSRQGKVPEDEWETFYVEDGHEITVLPVIEGIEWAVIGGMVMVGLKAVGAAIVAAAPYLAVASLLTQGIMLLTAKSPSTGSQEGGADSSPTYGWDGVQNTMDVDVPVAVPYGTVRMGGNYLNTYIESNENDNFLNILIGLGEGPLQSIAGITADTDAGDKDAIADKILVDGNPVDNYDDIDIFIRLGNESQAVVPGFTDIHDLLSFGDTIQLDWVGNPNNDEYPEGYERTTTGDDVEEIVLHFKCPSMYKTNKSGIHSTFIPMKIYWRVVGGSYNVGQDFMMGPALSMSAIRRSYTISNLTPGRYEVKIEMYGGEARTDNNKVWVKDCFLYAWDEVRYDKHVYPFTALLGLKVLATSQLSGSLPNITVAVEGRKVETAGNPDIFSENAIYCLRELFLNTRYGAGQYISAEHMPLADYATAAAYCDAAEFIEGGAGDTETRHVFGFVLDAFTPALDVVANVCASINAWAVWRNNTIQFVFDKATTATQLFTMGNVVENSLQIEYVATGDSTNTLEIQFADDANYYQRNTAMIRDATAYSNGDPIRKDTSFLLGVHRLSEAIRVGIQSLQKQRLSTKVVSFKAGIDAVTCVPGDVIYVAHDLPIWGIASGRVKSGAAQTVTLKEPVSLPLVSGRTYKILVRQTADDALEEATITDTGDIAAGTAINIAAPWSVEPVAFDVFSIGYTNVEKKPFRVMEMERTSDTEVQISATEYSAAVYDLSGSVLPVEEYSGLPTPNRPPKHVESLTAFSGPGYVAAVYLSWDVPDAEVGYGWHNHVDIFTSTDNETWKYELSVTGNTHILRNMVPGERIYFRALSSTAQGIKPDLSNAPTTSVVVAFPTKPEDVKGLEISGQGNDQTFVGKHVEFSWREVGALDEDPPAGEEETGAGAGVRSSYFQGYIVQIWDNTGALRRTEFVAENRYLYTFDKNAIDNEGVPIRAFTIAVWAYDKFNQVSENYASLYVTNDAPAALPQYVILNTATTYNANWNDLSPKPIDFEYYVIQRRLSTEDWSSPRVDFGGREISHYQDGLTSGTWYVRSAAIDSFGTAGSNWSSEREIVTP